MTFKDHFSTQAAIYREARPHYDPALFAWLAGLSPGAQLAWDAGCGNGQASVALAAHFRRVYASDPSAAQITAAEPAAGVEYHVERAEDCALPDHSTDLVTVAQALHWFDLARFHDQVRRVLRPGGVIAQWCYGDCTIDSAVDTVKHRLYETILGDYWPPERRLVETGYASLDFPFTRREAPDFALRAEWNLAQFLAYLRSWSATQRYIAARGEDPVSLVEPDFARTWGDAQAIRPIQWQLTVRVGRV
ncbi:class I SAM-dependent methyltransferase [Tahibacter amnicola]|uniref:Class I SAM-dependent methyltransferase n=1 Tax=Tahibacter amnicola TaxID=2976241 RepID=A0ABY6BF57_9GAMM|nr:class I SAM-dependent methyltransferase [Tahibacter amnicola]UXI68152.1 class I SAM-dependent methyltransferase [Tahibacter amnicola]